MRRKSEGNFVDHVCVVQNRICNKKSFGASMQHDLRFPPIVAARDHLRQHPPAVLAIYLLAAYVILLALISFIGAIDYRLATGQMLHAGTPEDPAYEMGAGLGFWAVIFFCLNFILATRWRWVETLFSGMDKVYQVHGIVGKLGFIFVIAHTGILVLQALPNTSLVASYLMPGIDLGYTLGVFGVVGMTLLVTATLWIRLPYGMWQNSHKWMIAPYLLGTGHAFVLQQDWYMLALSLVGGYAWFYTTFRYRRFAPRGQGRVESSHLRGTITDIFIRFNRPFTVEPGQFVYLSVTDSREIKAELHPFSVSGRCEDGIRLSVKALGDYTRSLKALKPGDSVTVFGPHGRFGARSRASQRNQVWLAGGIGITPFLSLLQSAADAGHELHGTLIWSMRERNEAVFLEDIERSLSRVPGIRFALHVTSETGYLSAMGVQEVMGETRLRACDIFICGPAPMMQGLTRQFIQAGTPRAQIITEAFSLKP
jgi:predicted ferric reductase